MIVFENLNSGLIRDRCSGQKTYMLEGGKWLVDCYWPHSGHFVGRSQLAARACGPSYCNSCSDQVLWLLYGQTRHLRVR